MRPAAPTALKVPPEVALVVRVPAAALASVIPLPLLPLDSFAEPEPSAGATIQLESGRYLVAIYGQVTERLSIHVSPSEADETIEDFLNETRLDPSAIVWRRAGKGLGVDAAEYVL